MGAGRDGDKDMVMTGVRRLSRTGQMYSVITILIIVPVVIFIALYMTSSQDVKFGTNERVVADQQHQVAQGIENDFDRAMRISCRRALLAAVSRITTNGEYLDNATLRISELMTNSTLYGNPNALMGGNTLYDWRDKILSQNYSFNIDANFSELRIENYDGTSLSVSMLMTLNVSDSLGLSRIDRIVRKNVTVSVEDLEDPIFAIGTGGYVKRIITAYPFPYYAMKFQGALNSGNCSGNSTYDTNDPLAYSRILVIQNATGIPDPTLRGFKGVVDESSENLAAKGVECFVSGAPEAAGIPENQTVYIDNLTTAAWLLPINIGAEGGYYYKGMGPNFLQRLEGNISESPDGKGLESFVLSELGIPDKGTQTRVDYLFFSNQTYAGCWKVRWTGDWLRMQPSEIARYNLTELSHQVC
jgi:hypothetical protein